MSEAVTRSCSVKKVFLKIFQNSQENTLARGFRRWHCVCIRITTDLFQILEIPSLANKYLKSPTETLKQDVKYAKS